MSSAGSASALGGSAGHVASSGAGGDAGGSDARGGAGNLGGGGSGQAQGGSANGGDSGSGGEDDEVTGGSSSAGASGEAGAGGSAGASGAAGYDVSQDISRIVPELNDLRGLVFSKTGKLYASGHIGADVATTDRKLAVARFDSDGELDPSFGEGGIVALNLAPQVIDTEAEPDVVSNDGNEQSLGVVELANGDVIVQGTIRDTSGKGTDVVLIRLDSSGELVTSFGEDGVQRIDFGWTPDDAADWTAATGPNDDAWGVALDTSTATEKVVVFGFGPAKKGQLSGNPATQRTDNDRYIARVIAESGALDPDFNGGSVFTLNTGGTFSDGGRRGLVEADGSIVSAGYTNYGDLLGNHIVVIRLRPNGTPDPSFGFGIALPGVARANPFLDDGGVAECYSLARQSGGRYVTAGYGRATLENGASKYGWAPTQSVDLVSFGFTADGLDETFGRDATLAIQSEEFALGNNEDRGRDVLALKDDRLVFVGRFGPNPAIFVTTEDGELDTSVGDGGKFVYPPLGETSGVATSHFYRVVASPDGTRLAAATNNHPDGALLAFISVSPR